MLMKLEAQFRDIDRPYYITQSTFNALAFTELLIQQL